MPSITSKSPLNLQGERDEDVATTIRVLDPYRQLLPVGIGARPVRVLLRLFSDLRGAILFAAVLRARVGRVHRVRAANRHLRAGHFWER